MENEYIIKGGEEGKKRLAILAEILHEYTKAFIEADGKIDGKKFLDLGCGGGDIALMAAQMLGTEGSVVAIDRDKEIVALAKTDAEFQGVNNITFRVLNAYDLDYSNVFDIAYSRFLLSHLQEPAIVLKKMIEAVKPGGKILIEDIDFSGHFCYPSSAAFELYLNYYVTAAQRNGQHPNIGLSLFGMFKMAGLEDITFDFIQPCFSEGQGKWMAWLTMDKIKETVMNQCLASEEEIEKILLELETFTNDSTSIISLPRIFRVRGKKAFNS